MDPIFIYWLDIGVCNATIAAMGAVARVITMGSLVLALFPRWVIGFFTKVDMSLINIGSIALRAEAMAVQKM